MVTVNGDPRDISPGATLADLVGQLTESPRGVAAAVNGDVVRRAAWESTRLAAGDQIEVVTAVQGG